MSASTFVIAAPTTPSVAVAGSDQRFPIRRVFCVGRNYLSPGPCNKLESEK